MNIKRNIWNERGLVHMQSGFYLLIILFVFVVFFSLSFFIRLDQAEIDNNFNGLRTESIIREFNQAHYSNGNTYYMKINKLLSNLDTEYLINKEKYKKKYSDLLKSYFDNFEYLNYDIVVSVENYVFTICYEKLNSGCDTKRALDLLDKEISNNIEIDHYIEDGLFLKKITVIYSFIEK